MGAKIVALCSTKAMSVSDLTRGIYDIYTNQAVGKIYRCVETLCGEGVLSPTFNNHSLRFKYSMNNGGGK